MHTRRAHYRRRSSARSVPFLPPPVVVGALFDRPKWSALGGVFTPPRRSQVSVVTTPAPPASLRARAARGHRFPPRPPGSSSAPLLLHLNRLIQRANLGCSPNAPRMPSLRGVSLQETTPSFARTLKNPEEANKKKCRPGRCAGSAERRSEMWGKRRRGPTRALFPFYDGSAITLTAARSHVLFYTTSRNGTLLVLSSSFPERALFLALKASKTSLWACLFSPRPRLSLSSSPSPRTVPTVTAASFTCPGQAWKARAAPSPSQDSAHNESGAITVYVGAQR